MFFESTLRGVAETPLDQGLSRQAVSLWLRWWSSPSPSLGLRLSEVLGAFSIAMSTRQHSRVLGRV